VSGRAARPAPPQPAGNGGAPGVRALPTGDSPRLPSGDSPRLPTERSADALSQTQTPKQPNNPNTAPNTTPRSGAQGYYVTDYDIARGWRVECVTTNEAYSFEMPTNGVECTRWRLRGGREMRFGLDLGDFRFPLGTNMLSRVCVLSDGTIWTLPPVAPKKTICAAAEWASHEPGASRFWSADTPDGSKLLTWQNVAANRDGTGRYDAQIELFPNGDFAMRSNLVETVCRRVNPDDWDGDGLVNEIDGCPTEYDGDCFGTSAAWYSEGCGSLLWGETNAIGVRKIDEGHFEKAETSVGFPIHPDRRARQ